jgi:hypothetical protein
VAALVEEVQQHHARGLVALLAWHFLKQALLGFASQSLATVPV